MNVNHSPHVPSNDTLDAARAHFEKFLRGKDLKLTNQRWDVLEAAARIGEHFSADDLVDSLRRKKIRPSKATIYRTLSLLTEAGVLDSHEFQQNASSIYEFSWGRSHHDHLICLNCRAIVEFFNQPIEDLQEKVAADHAFHPLSHSQKIYGICSKCWGKGVRTIG